MTGETGMRILHVYRTYFPDAPGGVQEAIRQIALSTRPHGMESRVFTLSPTPHPSVLPRPEGRVIRARSWAAPASCDLGAWSAVSRFRAQARWADLIHYHFPWPYADLLDWLVSDGKPAVMTYHSDIINKGLLTHLYHPLMRHTLSRMDAVIATSPAYADSSPILKRHVEPAKQHIIPLGILESTYQAARESAATLDPAGRLGLEAGQYFLFIGGLRRYKGLDVLAQAAANCPLPLVIVGRGQLAEDVRILAAQYPHVHHLENVDEPTKMALLRDCRALVLPSSKRSEAFGMVLVEAAMMGRPAITTCLDTGTSYVVEHEKTGLTIPPSDAKALGTALRQLLDDKLACHLGWRARERYERHFSGEALGRGHAQLYRSLTSERQEDA